MILRISLVFLTALLASPSFANYSTWNYSTWNIVSSSNVAERISPIPLQLSVTSTSKVIGAIATMFIAANHWRRDCATGSDSDDHWIVNASGGHGFQTGLSVSDTHFNSILDDVWVFAEHNYLVCSDSTYTEITNFSQDDEGGC